MEILNHILEKYYWRRKRLADHLHIEEEIK
jgi:hypothetical protein